MRELTYPATVTHDEDGRYVVTFPGLPYGATDGATLNEALREASDCLEEVVAGLMTLGAPVPAGGEAAPGQHLIAMGAQMSAKLALYQALHEARIPNTELAQRLSCDEREVRRMLDPAHGTKLPRLEQALAALGKRLVLSLADAA